MVLVCSEQGADAVRSALPEAQVVGEVIAQAGQPRVVLEPFSLPEEDASG